MNKEIVVYIHNGRECSHKKEQSLHLINKGQIDFFSPNMWEFIHSSSQVDRKIITASSTFDKESVWTASSLEQTSNCTLSSIFSTWGISESYNINFMNCIVPSLLDHITS